MGTIAIGDVHGNLAALDDLLNRITPEISAEDTTVFLGDYLDRGPDSKGCIERIIEFRRTAKGRVVTLLGNHEEWLLRTYEDHTRHSWLLGMEAFQTIRSYSASAAATLREEAEKAALRLVVERVSLPYEVFFASITTNGDGNSLFLADVAGQAPLEAFITAVAYDANGNPSGTSECIRLGQGNDSWPKALDVTLSGAGIATGSVVDYIDLQGQSRWFKVSVQPGSKLTVALTNLPDNYALTVYKDIKSAFKELSTSQDLLQLSAEFAPDSFSPDSFSPDSFSPDSFSSDSFSPDSFSPDSFSPDIFSPDSFARPRRPIAVRCSRGSGAATSARPSSAPREGSPG